MKQQTKHYKNKPAIGFNPIHSEKDLKIIETIFGSIAGHSHDEQQERETTYEIDYLPKFKFREVSELSIKLHLMTDKAVNEIYDDLKHFAQVHNYFRKENPKHSTRQKIQAQFKWLHNHFGYNTWVVYDQWKEQASCERTIIHKLKFLQEESGACRWTLCFMPSLEKMAPVTFDFMCFFINSCLQAGISSYASDQTDMLLDFFVERIAEMEEEESKDESMHEITSYREGEPKRIMQAIRAHFTTDKGLLIKFNEWKQYLIDNRYSFNGNPNLEWKMPMKVVNEIEAMCKLLAQDISIEYYEKHECFNSDDGPESNSHLFAFDWDDGHFQTEVQEYVNMVDGERGHVELADSLVIKFGRKETFIGKGHVLQQFLHLWNHNSIFNYFNETFENITARTDGAAICHRALQAKRQTRKKPIRRASSNHKPRTTSRNTVHV